MKVAARQQLERKQDRLLREVEGHAVQGIERGCGIAQREHVPDPWAQAAEAVNFGALAAPGDLGCQRAAGQWPFDAPALLRGTDSICGWRRFRTFAGREFDPIEWHPAA